MKFSEYLSKEGILDTGLATIKAGITQRKSEQEKKKQDEEERQRIRDKITELRSDLANSTDPVEQNEIKERIAKAEEQLKNI